MIVINFFSSKPNEDVMHWRSDNIKSASYNNVNEVVHELFQWLGPRYQGNLEKLMRGSDFILESVQLIY